MSSDPKDLQIENLKNSLEEYKKKLQSMSYDTLTAKISELEGQLSQKAKECEDLKSSMKMNAGNTDVNEFKTKIILLQSKIRASEAKTDELTKQKEELENKCKRLEGKSAEGEQVDVLKRQLKQEMEMNERLRNQMNQAQNAISPQAQAEIQNLRQQVQALQQQRPSQGSGGANPQDLMRLRNEIATRDTKIAELEKQLVSGGSSMAATGPMANVRLQREINALKSQIEMMKKNELDMKRKYEDAMRKAEFKEDQEW